jgi:AcrR family transcriptional regulator
MAGRPRSFDRHQALSRAMEVFWAKGYADASMADLTAAMGINAPSLYGAFGSKEDLFREAVRLYGATEGATLWASVREARTAREAVEGLLTATVAANGRCDRPSGCLISLSRVQPDSLPDAAGADLAEIRAEAIAEMKARMAEGQAAGEIADDADPAAMAAFYITVQQGMVMRAREGASSEELAGTARAAMLAWDGLAGVRRS